MKLGLDNPDKLWANFDFYTGALESKHSDIALESIKNHGVFRELKWAWYRKHGVNPKISKRYRHIEGDEGYESFQESYNDLLPATEKAQGLPVRTPEERRQAGYDAYIGATSESSGNGQFKSRM